LEVRQGSLEEQNFPPQSFNAVTMSHVIEHVHEPLKMLQECHRILKPGGMLVAVTPNVSSTGHKLFRSAWFPLEPPRHLHLFTPQSLKRLGHEAGFTTVEVKTSTRDLYYTSLRSLCIRRTGRASMTDYQNPISEQLFALAERLFELLLAKITTQ